MHRIALTTAVLCAGLAWPVLAQVTPEGYTDDSFCTADYSPGETDERYSSEFGEMDLDDDGMVSQEEYIKCRKAAAEA